MRQRSRALLTWLGILGTLCLAPRASLAKPFGAIEAPSSEVTSDTRKVSFDITPLESCNFGDLDLILNDLRDANGELRLQLSVETLDDEDRYVVYGSPREQMHEGSNLGTYDVLLPEVSNTRGYAVFLCSVTPAELKNTPCSRLPIQSFTEMMRPYSLAISFKPGERPSGLPFSPPRAIAPKIYYTQYFLASESTFWIPRDSSKDIFQDLPEKTRGEIRKVRSTIGSLPLRTSDGRLQLVVPFFSEKKCNSR